MSFTRYISRYAHCSGYTHCTYSEDGKNIITCGKDGDIRIWNGKDDDDASSNGISEYVNCVVQYENRILVATDLNIVSAYTFPECKKDGIEFRFAAPATTIQFNSTWIAAGAEDFVIKVVKKDKSEELFELKEHEGPIIAIALNKDNLLASKGGDGKIKIWDLEKQKVIHTISGLDQTKTFDTALTYKIMSFEPKTGKYFAYCNGNKIICLNTSDWSEAFTLSDSKATQDFTVCEFSPSGKLLAAGTCKGELFIWNIASKKTLLGDVKPMEMNAVTSIAWNPDQDKYKGHLVLCDSTGQIEFIVDAIDPNTVSREEPVKAPKHSRKPTEIDELENEENDIYKEYGFADDEALDDEMGDDDGVSLERIKNETLKYGSTESLSEKSKRPDTPSVREVPRAVDIQRPFQPGATPVSLEHRFMVWNHIGIVRSHKTDTEDSIEVEFHDTSTHHGIHMNNHLNHTMASLSSSVLALACESPSKLVCITLKAVGSREWSISMPDCEEIVAVCASDKLVAVATDSRLLRIFTVLGTQREVIMIPGPTVALAAHDEQIIVTYHNGTSPINDQNISMMVIDCFGYNIKSKESLLALTPNSKLTWIGFTMQGSPIVYDSHGLMSLYRHKSGCWFPVWNGTNHTKGASDTFFIVSVSESQKEVHAILCRGCPYPQTVPRPLVNTLTLEMPLCDMDLEKSQLEEQLLGCRILNVDDCKRTIKENTIKLFALACKSELENRARELIELISMPDLIPMAVKYASGLGRIHLAQKLEDMIPQVEEKQREIEEKLNAPEPETVPHLLLNGSSSNPLLSSSPIIAPAPILKPKHISGRNPFKKMNTSGSSASNIQNNSNKLFSHLSDMGLGYSSSLDSQASNISLNESLEKSEEKELNFVQWLTKYKEDLKVEFPTEDSKEFNKACLSKYKTWKENRKIEKTEKRKLDDSEAAETTGISKLAKFAKA